MPLRLNPVRMKNSLYLLIPKGISELLELDEHNECVLTAERNGRNAVLRYTFHTGGTVPHEPGGTIRDLRHRSKAVPEEKTT